MSSSKERDFLDPPVTLLTVTSFASRCFTCILYQGMTLFHWWHGKGFTFFSSHSISTSSLCTCINRVNFSVTSFSSCKLCRYCTGMDQNIQRPKKPPHLAWNHTCLHWYDNKSKWHSSNTELLQVSCYNMWKYLTLCICPSVFYPWRTIHIFSICSWGFSHQTEWYTKFIVGGIKHVCKLRRLDVDGLLMVTARTGTSV